MSSFEFAILGAGAIGSILGAHLASAGHSVVMLARERRAHQIERDGLRIRGLIELSTPVATLTDPTKLSSADVLIVAMKTPGTAGALERLGRAEIGTAFSIQNGLLKDELLSYSFGQGRVLGALADTSGEMLSSGEVMFTRNVNILLGELSGEKSPRAQHIAEAIHSSGVCATAVTNILALEWSKFVAWAGLMVLSLTTRTATWKYLIDPGSAVVLARLVREMGLLARASGVDVVDQSVLPVATMCRGSEKEGVDAVIKVGRQYKVNSPQHRMSSLQDLEAGRALELEETLGHALRNATRLGLPLPLLDSFYQLASAIDRIRRED